MCFAKKSTTWNRRKYTFRLSYMYSEFPSIGHPSYIEQLWDILINTIYMRNQEYPKAWVRKNALISMIDTSFLGNPVKSIYPVNLRFDLSCVCHSIKESRPISINFRWNFIISKYLSEFWSLLTENRLKFHSAMDKYNAACILYEIPCDRGSCEIIWKKWDSFLPIKFQ